MILAVRRIGRTREERRAKGAGSTSRRRKTWAERGRRDKDDLISYTRKTRRRLLEHNGPLEVMLARVFEHQQLHDIRPEDSEGPLGGFEHDAHA